MALTQKQIDNLPPEEIKNIQDYRIALLEKHYEKMTDRMERLGDRIESVRVEMHGMLWKMPSIIIVAMTVIKWLSKYL